MPIPAQPYAAIPPFEASKLKVRRARGHIAELAREIDCFLERQPFRLVVEMMPGMPADMPAHAWTVRIREPVPPALSAILGDVIHNLRSALDLLACDLVRVNGGETKGVMFPFCTDAEDLGQVIRQRRLHRAGRDVVEVLRSLKPYKGGNAALRAIHDLDIDDKHKALIPAIGAVSVPPFTLNWKGQDIAVPQWDSAIVQDGHMPIMMPVMENLCIGTELPALFRLVFPAGTALGGREMIPTLHHLAQLTDDVIDKLAMLRPDSGTMPAGTAAGGCWCPGQRDRLSRYAADHRQPDLLDG